MYGFLPPAFNISYIYTRTRAHTHVCTEKQQSCKSYASHVSCHTQALSALFQNPGNKASGKRHWLCLERDIKCSAGFHGFILNRSKTY